MYFLLFPAKPNCLSGLVVLFCNPKAFLLCYLTLGKYYSRTSLQSIDQSYLVVDC